MAIPSVVQDMIETEDGKVFELDSPKGFAWLESIGSFRFEPSGDSKPYTVRKEAGAYWYGCRKVAGKVRKKYIGKSSKVSIAKLEEIAEALKALPVPRVKEVAEVAQVAQQVAEVAQDRLTALEEQVANLLKAVETLQEALPGKLEASDSLELPKVDNEVAEQLQNELCNLKAENEKLRGDYAALLESSTAVTNKLREEVREVRSQLATKHADREEIEAELAELAQLKKEVKEAAAEVHREGRSIELEKVRWQQQLSDTKAELKDAQATIVAQRDKTRNLERGYGFKPTPTEGILRRQIGELQTELSDLKQNLAPASELPEAADLLNQLKAKRKKSTVSLPDIEAILGMIEESWGHNQGN